MPPARHPAQPFFSSWTPTLDHNRRLLSLVPSSRMNSASSRQTAAMSSPQSASPFWQLLAILAEEPDLRWLDWVLRQREGTTSQARAEAAARPAEAIAARSRSRPGVRATFLEEEPAAVEEEAPPSGGAAGGHHCAGNDCRFCRSQASHHFGPWPLEALTSVMHSTHPRIWRIYKVGLRRFVAFRGEAGLPSAWPIPREQIRGFLVTLDSHRLPSPNIIAYLAGLAFISRMLHFPDPLQDFLIPRLVTGLHRRGDIKMKGWTPLSVEMLWCLVEAVDNVCTTDYDRVLFQAVFLLAWFAALRPEEIVAEDDNTSLDRALLCLNDFEFSEDSIRIQLRVLGIGPERFEFRLGRGKESLLFLTVSKYLEARPRIQGPFFIHANGEPLTKRQFLAVFDRTLTLVGLLPQHFSINSFWVGAMITAVKIRLPEQLMLRLARCPNRSNPQ